MWTPGGQIDLLTFAALRKKGGGGGGNPMYTTRTYTDPVDGTTFTDTPIQVMMGQKSAADQLNEHIQQRQAQQQQVSQQAETKQQQQAQTAETNFQGARDTAYQNALNAVTRSFQLQGVDPNQYMQSDIIPTLQRQLGTIQDLDPNPSAAFPTSLGDTIIGNITGGKRSQALNALNTTFSPTYALNALPSSAMNPYVEQIVGEQFDPLQTQLDNAYRRGMLNDTGYAGAKAALEQKRSGARATVQSLGENILSGERGSLNDYINTARNAANAVTLAGSFDPTAYTGQAQTMVGSNLANLGGAIRNAVGDTRFANITDLLSAGGIAQGPANTAAPSATGGVSPISPTQQSIDEMAKQKRGLGSTGAF